MKLSYLPLLLLFAVYSCNREKEIIYSAPEKAQCNADTLNSYHYILPGEFKAELPLLIILDSGGDGLMAVQLTKPAVSRIPFVVIGSDLVRNNFPGYIKAIDELIADASLKYHISKLNIYLGGFSGGARMAFEYARNHQVKGVLMCSAGPDQESLPNLPCPVYMIAGTSDFNFQETYYNPLTKPAQQKFLSDYFRGKHQWPDAEMMKVAYIYLAGSSIPGGKGMRKHESSILSDKADSLLLAGDTFFALKAVEIALSLNPDNKKANRQFAKIKSDKLLAGEIGKIESDLFQEGKVDQLYSQDAVKRDSAWWASQLNQLSVAIDGSKGEKQDHYLRVKAFLGILFYSHLNSMIRSQPSNPQIAHLLSAYRTAEPDNPDVYYNYALYEFKTGKDELSRNDLIKAISLGFKDQLKMEHDFPPALLAEVISSIN